MNDHVHPAFHAALRAVTDPRMRMTAPIDHEGHMARIQALWSEREAIERTLDDVRARIADEEAAYNLACGDLLSAEWCRLRAVTLRNRTHANEQAEQKAWLVMMATMHMRAGTAPDGHRAVEIAATMEDLRGVKR